MSALGAADRGERPRRVVILAGSKSHGPAGNGIHDYAAQARLLADCLARCQLGAHLAVRLAEDGAWPSAAIAQADAVVVISDGRDGDAYADAVHLADPGRMAELEAAVARGAGICVLHFATFTPERDLATALRWQGGAFAWEQGGRREWRSRITWATGMLDRCGEHPVTRGVGGGPLREEYYHRMVLHPRSVPLVAVRALPGESADERVVAWALEREEGGRGFGTGMGHSLDSLRHDGLRTLLLNGIVWSAGLEPPADGSRADFAEREAVDARLGLRPDPGPIRVALLAGNAAHRWHHWPETSGALLAAWAEDARISPRLHTDPADLVEGLADRDVLVLNWANWKDPVGIPERARAALRAFTERGGGVVVLHFANGACHPSLPGAEASDWPWYRTLVRRVWEHRDLAPGPSRHDRFRRFAVTPRGDHPLVAGLRGFEVEDELYWRQHGTEPIEPLLTARSEESGVDEPLLWTYPVGRARVAQCLLGHSAAAWSAPAMRVLARRMVAWCADRALHGPPLPG